MVMIGKILEVEVNEPVEEAVVDGYTLEAEAAGEVEAHLAVDLVEAVLVALVEVALMAEVQEVAGKLLSHQIFTYQ